jgi:outer membrane receptor for ferrienterochelin and colicins
MKKKMKAEIFFMLLFFSGLVFAQSASIEGQIRSAQGELPHVVVYASQLGKGTFSNENGYFRLNDLPRTKLELEFRLLGFKTQKIEVNTQTQDLIKLDIELQEDILGLDPVVVTASRTQTQQELSPVLVNILSRQTFERTQSLTLAEGLGFSAGLRVENNCQNCGFNQLRMNGMQGPYAQILLNSRPVFSALAGVYALEMIPSAMIERVEVVKGGGSTLFGGNAIAGTVNIITKEPSENSYELQVNQAYFGQKKSDRSLNFNAQTVNKNLNKGLSLYGYHRDRDPWDANGDGFSELTRLKNKTFGAEGFWNLSPRAKLKAGAFHIKEFRRGGNKLNLQPHQAEIAEQLDHNITSTNLSLERYSKNYKHKFSIYSCGQWIKRDSYYGGLSDSLYGHSNDFSAVLGLQHNFMPIKWLSLTYGSELQHNKVEDLTLGFGRSTQQTVQTLGNYAQIEIAAHPKVSFVAGLRADRVHVLGKYDLKLKNFEQNLQSWVWVSRFSTWYAPNDKLKIRASLAQGYRAPQAFNEDLHIEMVGGAVRFIAFSPELQMERSLSQTLSLDYRPNPKTALTMSAFHTVLQNPFILAEPFQDPSGVSILTKRNGSGATVKGINGEWNQVFAKKFSLLAGATLQTALYHNDEIIWSDQREKISTRKILKTPDFYGFVVLSQSLSRKVKLNHSGVFTGPMSVAQVVDFETERTIIKNTPCFFEFNTKISYTLFTKTKVKTEIFLGGQNLFDSRQRDFQVGANRDAGYVYGPMRGRTLFLGLKLSNL